MPQLIPMLESYAKRTLRATDRKPIDQAIDRIRFAKRRAAARIRSEIRRMACKAQSSRTG